MRERTPTLLRAGVLGAAWTVALCTVVASVGWIDHVTRESTAFASGADLSPDYPGALALTIGAPVPDVPLRPAPLVADLDLPAATLDGCIEAPDTDDPLTCLYGDTSARRTIALVGGSHSEHWLGALDLLGRQYGFAVRTYLKVGCPLGVPDSDGSAHCDTWSGRVLDELREAPPEYVFTTSTRPRDASEGTVKDNHALLPGDLTPAWYVDLWNELGAHGIDVVAIRDTPWLRTASGPRRPADCLTAGGDITTCGIARAEALDPVDPARAPTAAMPWVHLIDLTDAVCGPTTCRVAEGNVLIYRDADHLTQTYVRTLAPAIGDRLREVTGWW